MITSNAIRLLGLALLPLLARAQEGASQMREVVPRDSTQARITFIVEPAAAMVMVDSMVLRSTRVTMDIPEGQYRVIVRHPDSGFTMSDRYHYFGAGVNDTVRVILRRLIASIDIRGVRTGDGVSIDGWLEEHAGDTVLFVSPDTVRLAFTNGQTGNKLTATLRLYPEERFRVDYRPDRMSAQRFIPSIIVPGWTQFNDGSHLKAGAIFAANAGSLVFLVGATSSYNSAETEYQRSLLSYLNTSSESEAAALRLIVQDRYDGLQSRRKTMNAARLLFVGAYLFNLVDAALLHSFADDIEFIRVDEVTPQWPTRTPTKRSPDVGTRISVGVRLVRR